MGLMFLFDLRMIRNVNYDGQFQIFLVVINDEDLIFNHYIVFLGFTFKFFCVFVDGIGSLFFFFQFPNGYLGGII